MTMSVFAAAARDLVPDWLPGNAAVPPVGAVSDLLPAVFRVALKLCTPASAA